jgi:uncharacterized protein (DUF2141 family)
MTNTVRHIFQVVFLKIVNLAKWGFVSVAMLFSSTVFAADTPPALAIQMSGFDHDRGQAVVNVFRATDDVLKPDTAYRHLQAEIYDGRASITIPDLAYGKYAISVFHDENGNGTLDHNFFRFPAEPLGFSNYFKLSLTSGMPSFEKLQFQFAAETAAIEISLK